MLFNSFSYLLFLPTVVLLYWRMPDRWRKVFLLAASYFFYMSWKPAYGLLILILTLVNFGFGLAIARSQEKSPAPAQGSDKIAETPHRRPGKALLILGLIFNLGALSYFKYTNFLLESFFSGINFFAGLTHASGFTGWDQPVLNIILPLGISFFTFEFIHYIVDVYRGSKPVKSFIDFALFASFFPSQIAGPIKRFQDFMQQMGDSPAFKSQQFREGIFLILQGLFKKVALGDNLSPLVARGFAGSTGLALLDAWITVIAFSYQLYFDFSGYTDIGRGSALLLGYKVPENFNLPYLAANLTDFWRRWHMSLSSWLRDYLFISLGGSRCSPLRTNRNLILTMVLGGLWHGAAWHFVIWGAIHGFGLVLFKAWSNLIAGTPVLARLQKSRAWHMAGILFTNLFVYLAFAVFRASNLLEANDVVARFFGIGVTALTGEVLTQLLQSPLTAVIPTYSLYCLARAAVARQQAERDKTLTGSLGTSQKPLGALSLIPVIEYWDRTPSLRYVTYASVLIAVIGLAPSQYSPFIYFQF